MQIGFFAYLGCCLVFYALAVYAFVSKRPVGIWANEPRPKSCSISDIRGYNRAVGKLFLGYGTALAACGLPMVFDAHIAVLLVVSVLGVVFATFAMIAVAVKIDHRYRGKH